MVKNTHIQGGVAAGLVTNPVVLGAMGDDNFIYKIFIVCVYIYGCYLGSLLPDIDFKNSYISKKMPLVYNLIGKKCKHRGVTHSWVGLLVISALSSIVVIAVQNDYFGIVFAQGIVIGYGSHIILDLFTREGVAFFHPIKKTICLGDIKTSSRKEKKLCNILKVFTIMALGVNMYICVGL